MTEVYRLHWWESAEVVYEALNPRLQDLTDMKSLSDIEVKKLATRSGPEQSLAFYELARRVRDRPSSWSQPERPWFWDALDCTRAPNVSEMEWAFLKWSQHLNDEENYEFKQEQNARLDELERRLDQDTDTLEIKYFNAIGEELRRRE